MPAPTYWDYLKLDQLLALQGGLEGDEDALLADELHFIVVHQVYELWFKLVIRSIRLARDRLSVPRVAEETIPFVTHHLRRVCAILRLAVAQFDLMETLTPQDFLAFRDKLVPSSGFQSFQMRVIEVLLGLEDVERVRYGEVDPIEHIRDMGRHTEAGRVAWDRVEEARAEGSFQVALRTWLFRTPIQGSHPDDPGDDGVVTRFLEAYLERLDASQASSLGRLVEAFGERARPELHDRVQDINRSARVFLFGEDAPEAERHAVRRRRAAALFIESYRELPLLAWPRLLLDVVVEMEELLVLWRTRHARMVERLIGRRVGTGGSQGVAYLDKTAQYRIFRDLWAIRTVLLPRAEVPPLEHPELYGFAQD